MAAFVSTLSLPQIGHARLSFTQSTSQGLRKQAPYQFNTYSKAVSSRRPSVIHCRHPSQGFNSTDHPDDDIKDSTKTPSISLSNLNPQFLSQYPVGDAKKGQINVRNRMVNRLGRVLLVTAFSVIIRCVCPAIATTAAAGGAVASAVGPLAKLSAIMESSSFLSGLAASFLLVLASEIGDKTFFISALLSMKYSRFLVLVGTMVALASMTVISVGIGQIFHALPNSLNSSIPFDDYAAVALLLWFGWQNIRDGLAMRADDEDELQDAKEVVEGKVQEERSGVRVVAETSSLIFLAEWGDKSMLATVALAAAKNPWGVIVGGVSGHFIASIIAVVGGSVLGKFISERNARLIGGVLFFVFAVLTIFGIY